MDLYICREHCELGVVYFTVLFGERILGFDSSFRSVPSCVLEVIDGYSLEEYGDRTLKWDDIEVLFPHLRVSSYCPFHVEHNTSCH